MLNKIKQFFYDMVCDRSDGVNSKIFVGLIFAVVMIIGLFVGVDSSLYNIFALCTMGLLGLSCIDNLTAPKIEVNKTETTTKESKTSVDVANIANKIIDKVAGKDE